MEERGRRNRKWGSACLNCRKRKIRCDGARPCCANCIKAADDCAYKASDAVNAELEVEIHRRNEEIARLKRGIQSAVERGAGPEQDEALSALLANVEHTSPDDNALSQSSPATAVPISELSVDDSGHVRHHGPTSRFYSRPYENRVSQPDQAEEDYHRKWLRSNARFQPSWEAKALERLNEPPFCHDITPANAQVLLDIYWTWQAPLHNYVYRRCFYRDMALGGPYFSPFLLYVLFAHAGRHIRPDDPRFPGFDKGERFLSKAKNLVIDELDAPKIPAVQGLLLLGGRQSAVGKTSEGWVFTSMAIAMVKDLGLHLWKDAGSLLKQMEPDDLEARKRLYLSAYIWDKSISLCNGRQPSLPEMPYPADCLLDDADDRAIWQPKYLDDLVEEYPQPTYSYETANFMRHVRLAAIINEVYVAIYSNDATFNPAIAYRLEKKLRNFHENLPSHLKVNLPGATRISPPPHIATVNILYHTALILLFRPFYQSSQPTPALKQLCQHAHRVCRAEAEAVNASFKAYGRTYNYHVQTHLLSYCVYTAATIDVQGMQSQDPAEARAATERLQVTLHMLDTEAEQTPGVRKSVDIIRAQISRMGQEAQGLSALPASVEAPTSESRQDPTPSAPSTTSAEHALIPDRSAAFPTLENAQQIMEPNFIQQGLPFSGDVSSAEEAYMLAGGEMPWFDWSDLDISGGFSSYEYRSSDWYNTEVGR